MYNQSLPYLGELSNGDTVGSNDFNGHHDHEGIAVVELNNSVPQIPLPSQSPEETRNSSENPSAHNPYHEKGFSTSAPKKMNFFKLV